MFRSAVLVALAIAATPSFAQVKNYVPVTQEMLLNPAPGDWLMYSRTYDAQRFSPLKEINRSTVSQLRMAWTRGIGPGTTETIPVVHNGVIYVNEPGGIVQALDGTNGDLLWEYKRKELCINNCFNIGDIVIPLGCGGCGWFGARDSAAI